MERTAVVSSNVKSVGWDREQQILEVEFKSNCDGVAAVWQYSPIPPIVYESMMAPGESIGHWIAMLKNDVAIEARRVDAEVAS